MTFFICPKKNKNNGLLNCSKMESNVYNNSSSTTKNSYLTKNSFLNIKNNFKVIKKILSSKRQSVSFKVYDEESEIIKYREESLTKIHKVISNYDDDEDTDSDIQDLGVKKNIEILNFTFKKIKESENTRPEKEEIDDNKISSMSTKITIDKS